MVSRPSRPAPPASGRHRGRVQRRPRAPRDAGGSPAPGFPWAPGQGESGKGRPRPWLTALVLVFLSGLAGQAAAGTQRQNACLANLRVLQGAVEMHDMDSTTPLPVDSPGLLDELRRGDYLKYPAVCPGPVFTFGTTRGNPGIMERLFPDAFLVTVPGASTPEYRLDASGSVYCTFHGSIDTIPARAEAARERAYTRRVLRLLDRLNIRSPFGEFFLLGGLGVLCLLASQVIRRRPP